MRYLKIILLSFLIASVFDVLGLFILQSFNLIGTVDNTDMRNLPYGIAITFNLLLALGTLPILLNLRSRIKDNLVRNGLSFFALPVVIMGGLAWSMEEEAWSGVVFCIPYFIVLSVFFVRFRNQNFAERS